MKGMNFQRDTLYLVSTYYSSMFLLLKMINNALIKMICMFFPSLVIYETDHVVMSKKLYDNPMFSKIHKATFL